MRFIYGSCIRLTLSLIRFPVIHKLLSFSLNLTVISKYSTVALNESQLLVLRIPGETAYVFCSFLDAIKLDYSHVKEFYINFY